MRRRGLMAAGVLALVGLGGAVVAHAQDPFTAALIEAAKQRANQAAADALARQTQGRPAAPPPQPAQQPPPQAMPAPVGGYDPFAAMRGGAAPPPPPPPGGGLTPAQAQSLPPAPGNRSPTYAGNPPYRSFWPSIAYAPPSSFSQAVTPVPPGTPDSSLRKTKPPMTDEGKVAWVYSEYELKTLSWGNALPPRGSAGAPEYVGKNINNSPARQKWISTFDGWIRATYQPHGAITAAFREIYPDKATQDYLPINYGVSETLYDPVVKGGKIYRTPAPPFGWINIFANLVQAQEPSWPFNVPGEKYLFTMSYDRDLRGTVPREDPKYAAEIAAVKARIGINAPVYLTTQLVVVLITRDGRLPVRQMTIGETLDAADAGIRRIIAKGDGSQEMNQRYLQGVARMRALHAAELNAPASVRNLQFLHYVFDSDQDVYGRNSDGSTYPVYTFEPQTYALAKSDAPQWLLVSFPRSLPSNAWNEQMAYDAMVNHFNFAYARDAVFNPQAVAGVPYAPRP